jgi:hypothetical protein
VAAWAVACSDGNSSTGPSGGFPLAPTIQTIVELNAPGGFPYGPQVLAQSVTVPAGSYNNIRFRWGLGAFGPPASGTLYILSQEVQGGVSGLGPSAPGFVARSLRITDGDYIFDSAVTLRGAAKYWFATDTPIYFMTSQGVSDVYNGGDLYVASNPPLEGPFSRLYMSNPSERFDANFRLAGSIAVQ